MCSSGKVPGHLGKGQDTLDISCRQFNCPVSGSYTHPVSPCSNHPMVTAVVTSRYGILKLLAFFVCIFSFCFFLNEHLSPYHKEENQQNRNHLKRYLFFQASRTSPSVRGLLPLTRKNGSLLYANAASKFLTGPNPSLLPVWSLAL